MAEYRGTLVDDDGVLIVSTSQQMAVIGSRGFDYDFPEELIALMTEGRIVAWETGEENEFPVEVVFADEPPQGAQGAFRLNVLAGDTGIVMPYSEFSYAAACAEGIVSTAPRLAIRFAVPVGDYHAFIAAIDSGFRITITPDRYSLLPISDDLPFIRGSRA